MPARRVGEDGLRGPVEAAHGRPERYRHEERQVGVRLRPSVSAAPPGDNQIHQQASTDYSDQNQGRGTGRASAAEARATSPTSTATRLWAAAARSQRPLLGGLLSSGWRHGR